MDTRNLPRPPRSQVIARPSRLTRAKLSEPARLYVYGLGSVIVVALVMRGLLDGAYLEAMLTALGTALGLVGMAEGVRATVYSPTTHVRDLVRAQAAGTVERAGGPW